MRSFSMVNPTSTEYRFTWENMDLAAANKKMSDFRLMQREGVIQPGKKTEVSHWSVKENAGCLDPVFVCENVIEEKRRLYESNSNFWVKHHCMNQRERICC